MNTTTVLRSALAAIAIASAPAASAMVTASCNPAPSNTFVPSWGQTYIGQDAYGRYVDQTFYWHAGERLAWLTWTSDSTLEVETWFYNYNNDAYGTEPSGYWESNLPYPYVDTQDIDAPGEKSITIGSASAWDLVPGVYYYITRMRAGGGTQSLVKVSVQRGRRIPSGCTSTWCAFACDSADNGLIPVPFQSYYVAPGCRQWWWNWYSTLNVGCQFP